ncbi:MAG TPA: hypothetical protein VJ898_06400 [Natrialbaceae archaeon]|nr:hypothetical protein [Natrialbaceae archaeon]
MDDQDLPAVPEPEALRDRLQSTFESEIEENKRRIASPKGSDSVMYSTGFRDELLAGLTDEFWAEWEAALKADGLSREDLDQLMALSTSVGINWVYGDVEWESVLEDVRRSVANAEEFLDGD